MAAGEINGQTHAFQLTPATGLTLTLASFLAASSDPVTVRYACHQDGDSFGGHPGAKVSVPL